MKKEETSIKFENLSKFHDQYDDIVACMDDDSDHPIGNYDSCICLKDNPKNTSVKIKLKPLRILTVDSDKNVSHHKKRIDIKVPLV